jgi:hypothetical protein
MVPKKEMLELENVFFNVAHEIIDNVFVYSSSNVSFISPTHPYMDMKNYINVSFHVIYIKIK